MIGFRLWQIAGWTMLHYLWVGALLGAAAILLQRMLRPTSANVRYALALVSLLLLTLAPAGIAVVVSQNVATVEQNESLPIENAAVGTVANPAENTRAPLVAMDAASADVPEPVVAADVALPVEASPPNERLLATLNLAAMCLPWLWVFGTPLSFALTTAGLLGAERLRRQSRPIEDAKVTEMCRQLAVTLRISYRVSVAICDRIAAPILVGVFRPMILLPAVALAGWNPQELEMVLLHELAHVRRYDNLVNLLQRIVESLLFFQPMVWIVSGWVRREREHCCDELVVARTREPHAYAEVLFNLSERFSQNVLRGSSLSHPRAVSSMAERPLVARIRRILNKEEQSMQVSRKAVGLAFVGLLAIVTTIGSYCTLPSRAEDSVTLPASETPSPAVAPAAVSVAAPMNGVKPITGKNYVVIPFNSDLQRTMRRSYKTATFYVLINGVPIINKDDTVLDVGAVDFKGLDDALQVFIKAGLLKRVIITAAVGPRKLTCQPGTASSVLLGLLREVPPTTDRDATLSYRDLDQKSWETLLADLMTPPTAETLEREKGIGDELVRVYPICTPLSRYLATAGTAYVVRNIKPFDQMTPEEIQAFPARVKTYVDKLGFKPTDKACFVVDDGTVLSKSRRTWRQLRISGDLKWWTERGIRYYGTHLWNDGHWTAPRLSVKVVGEDGRVVTSPRFAAAFAPEIKELSDSLKFTQENDGRWHSSNLPIDDEFTLTVEATGYRPNSQKITLPEGDEKELEVRLKPAVPKSNDPSAKTSAGDSGGSSYGSPNGKTAKLQDGKNIVQVKVVGNSTISKEDILEHAHIQTGTQFSKEAIEEDKERLIAYYRGQGFFRVRIGHELEFDEKENLGTVRAVHFAIDEGPRYKMRNIEITGNTTFTNEELQKQMTLKKGGYFDQDKMTADLKLLHKKLATGDYHALVKPEIRFVEDGNQLDLTYRVEDSADSSALISNTSADDDGRKLIGVSEGQTAGKPDNTKGEANPNADKTIMARVGAEVITAQDIASVVDDLLKQNKTKLSPEEYESERALLMKRSLQAAIQSKLILLDAKRRIPAEGMLAVDKAMGKAFEDSELPKMLKREDAANAEELDAKLKAKGSSIQRKKIAFCEKQLVQQWTMQQVRSDEEITYDQMMQYYTSHRGEFFNTNKESPSFLDVQQDIRKRITNERKNRRLREYLDQLRSATPVWTIYDENEVTSTDLSTNPAGKVEPTGAKKPVDDDIEVRFAVAAAAVEKAEWERVEKANKRAPGTVPQAQVERQRLAWQKMELAAVKARKDRPAGDDIDVRYAIAAAALAKAELQQAVDANEKLPAAVPAAEVERLRLAWQKMELAVLMAKRGRPASDVKLERLDDGR